SVATASARTTTGTTHRDPPDCPIGGLLPMAYEGGKQSATHNRLEIRDILGSAPSRLVVVAKSSAISSVGRWGNIPGNSSQRRATRGPPVSDIRDLDTPAVTVRLDIMEGNIRRVQAHLDRHGVGNRPHVKTHKIPEIGRMQMAAGAVGITVQKVGEAEVFVDAGVAQDVLLTYNVLGPSKLDRLMALTRRVRVLTVVLDSETVA